ncbi:hypothetical protein ACWGDE_01405 [Streptomyces sp. NPDC054956]
MRRHHTAAAVLAAAAIALTGCTSLKSEPKPDAKPTPAAPTAPAPTGSSAAAEPSGLPPEPSPDKRTIYLATLNGIDPEIVNGKEDKAVSRGRDQCASMKDEKDPTKRVESVNKRFIGPTHPDGFGPTKSALILATVQANICPTY